MPSSSSSVLASERLRRNNFDFLRLLFAGIVCLSHCYALTGMTALQPLASFLSAEIAVKSFFVISGFLIFMSYERSTSLKAYAIKRLRRIYPAYATIILFCALAFGFISTLPWDAYLSFPFFSYLIANFSFANFIQHSLPGVFENNPLTTVNGALWTLKIEVMFYMLVPLIVYLCQRWKRLPCLAFLYLLSVLYLYACAELEARTGAAFWIKIGRQLPGQLSYFIAGGIIYYALDFFEQHITPLLAATSLYFIVRFFVGEMALFEPAALGVLVCFFALFLFMGRFGKYGDFSYGVYIIHFPLIQTFIHFGWLQDSPALFVTTIAALTLLLSIGLWHLIEKRFLRRSSGLDPLNS